MLLAPTPVGVRGGEHRHVQWILDLAWAVLDLVPNWPLVVIGTELAQDTREQIHNHELSFPWNQTTEHNSCE
jgi:hypothetical protein